MTQAFTLALRPVVRSRFAENTAGTIFPLSFMTNFLSAPANDETVP